MIAGIVRRLASACVVLLGATILLFALTLAIPGNPALVLLGPRATPEAIAAYSQAMGLDRPVLVRLWTFLSHVAQGDLGRDVISGRPIATLIGDVLPSTLALTACAMGLAIGAGLVLGCLSAWRPGGVVDRVVGVMAVGFISIPNFLVAVLLLLVFAVWLGWLPVLGARGEPGAAGLLLPSGALALGWVGYLARLLRASLIDALSQPHATVQRAFGVSDLRIVGRYALRLAVLPVVALLGLGIGQMLGGAVFAEVVFARPGLGTLMLDAIGARNFPVVQAGVLVVVGAFVAVNVLADLLIAWLDPRIARAG